MRILEKDCGRLSVILNTSQPRGCASNRTKLTYRKTAAADNLRRLIKVFGLQLLFLSARVTVHIRVRPI